MKYDRLKEIIRTELNKDIDNRYEGELLGVNFTECGDFFVCKDGVYEHRYLPERSNKDRLIESYETEDELVKAIFKRITVYPKLRNCNEAFLEQIKVFKNKYESEL